MNFFEFNKQFPTEVDCIKYFIRTRYNNQVKCNHCGSNKISYRTGQLKTLQCNNCNK